MESISAQNLTAIIELYSQLDMVRAKKFVNPQKLENSIQSSDAAPILQERFPEWKFLLSGLKTGYASKIPTMELVGRLRKVEPYALFLWLIFTSAAMLTANSDLWRIQAGIAALVFTFLVGIRLANYYLVDKPAAQISGSILDAVPGTDQKLYDVISRLIDTVNQFLLDNGMSAYPYKHYMEFMEYPGIYYHGKRTLLGPRQIASTPFPLYSVLSGAKGSVKIIMARMEEKLIPVLSELPQEVTIQLLTLNTIARHTAFNIAVTNLNKAHGNLQITLLPPDQELKGVSVIVNDEVWIFDVEAKWNETRYIQVTDPDRKNEIERTFHDLWKKGKLTRIRA